MSSEIKIKESTTPGNPATGYAYVYVDTAGALHVIRDDGTDTTLGAATLATLTDVLIATPANGQTLIYNGTKWINTSSANKNAAARLFMHANFR